MSQPGFFDLSRRYESLDAKPDPLLALNRLIPWETFRSKLRSALEETGQRTTPEARKSPAGRKPWDEVLMFKVLVLQSLHNLADDNVEYLIRDRLSASCVSWALACKTRCRMRKRCGCICARHW